MHFSLKFSVLLLRDDFIFIAGKLSEVVLPSLAMAFFSQVGHENSSTVAAIWKYYLFSPPQNVTEDLLGSFICFIPAALKSQDTEEILQ